MLTTSRVRSCPETISSTSPLILCRLAGAAKRRLANDTSTSRSATTTGRGRAFAARVRPWRTRRYDAALPDGQGIADVGTSCDQSVCADQGWFDRRDPGWHVEFAIVAVNQLLKEILAGHEADRGAGLVDDNCDVASCLAHVAEHL
jgi:hypothetical protein